MDSEQMKERTKEFAHRCVKLSMSLPKSALGNHVRTQLIRCSTSIAANYRAACVAHSRPSFVSTLSVSTEEADESMFWLEFVVDEDLIDKNRVSELLKESKELTAILVTARKTAQSRK